MAAELQVEAPTSQSQSQLTPQSISHDLPSKASSSTLISTTNNDNSKSQPFPSSEAPTQSQPQPNQLLSSHLPPPASPKRANQTNVTIDPKPRQLLRIERDYSSGENIIQFWSGWLWELEGRITPTQFQTTLNQFNTILASASDPYKSIGDNVLAVLTFYLSPKFVTSHYQKEMAKFDETLQRVNKEIYNPAGLHILSPRRTGFLFMEVELY